MNDKDNVFRCSADDVDESAGLRKERRLGPGERMIDGELYYSAAWLSDRTKPLSEVIDTMTQNVIELRRPSVDRSSSHNPPEDAA